MSQVFEAVERRESKLQRADTLGRSISREVTFTPERLDSVEVEFSDLTLDVPIKNVDKKKCTATCSWETSHQKRILHGVSGVISPGSLVALMGASGAGKTTLLNVLSRRNKRNQGVVLYNGVIPTDAEVASATCFIQQEDMFFGNLTVQEHLDIQARLRLPRNVEKEERNRRLQSLIVKMGLAKCASSKIGNAAMGDGRGISGGEKKRLNIATELITAPSIIFADEPTTGLDSFIAYTAIGALRELADQGHTVICTIHQPNSRIFDMFDQLVLMGEGRILYSGDRLGAIEWFSRLGFSCPTDKNPADFLIKIVSLTDDTREEKIPILNQWADQWEMSSSGFLHEWESGLREQFIQIHREAEERQIDLIVETVAKDPTLVSLRKGAERSWAALTHRTTSRRELSSQSLHTSKSTYVNHNGDPAGAPVSGSFQRISFWRQFAVLLKRAVVSNSRDPVLFIARAMQTLIVGLIVGFLFFRLGWSQADAQTKIGAMFTILMNQSMLGALGVAQVFPIEKPIIRRENESGVVNIVAYTMAKMTADVPIQLVFPSIFAVLTYYMVGLNDNFVRFLISLGVILLTCNAAMSLGYLSSGISPSVDVAVVVTQLILLPLFLFSGFTVRLEDISKFWIWLEYLSPFKYGLSAFAVTVFHDVTIRLDSDDVIPGQEYLQEFMGFDTSNFFYAWCFVSLAILVVGFRIIALVLTTFVMKRSKENT